MDDLEELLRASAPAVEVRGSDAAFARVALAVAGRRRFSPRLWRRRSLVTVLAGLVLVPAVAAAGVLHFTAETGIFGHAGMTENDTSQYIDLCAGDISHYVKTLTPAGVALAPGSSWEQISSKYLAAFRPECPPAGPGVTTQTTGIKTSLLLGAQCPWERWALSTRGDQQDASLSRADRALAAIESDIATVQTDDGRTGTSSAQYTTLEHRYAEGSRRFLDYDYQVNCLGRDTSQNPPTVKDPDK
jgi:hypothetical protein